MESKKIYPPILQTKLNRPPVARDHLHRQHLLNWLNQRRQRPLTLLSAPAGYGKSTLVGCWLESCDCPNAWLSLDERDSGLQPFLAQFLAASATMFPGAVSETKTPQKAIDLPPLSTPADTLINELNEIDKDFILLKPFIGWWFPGGILLFQFLICEPVEK